MTVGLDDPVTALEGVGPKAAALLAEVGVRTVYDLITYWPTKHRDLGDLTSVEEAEVGEVVTLIGVVDGWRSFQPRNRRLTITEAEVVSPSGGAFGLTYFNQPWIGGRLPVGTRAAFSGKLERFGSRIKINNPQVELLDDGDDVQLGGRLRPQYAATRTLPSVRIAATVEAALATLGPLEEWVDEVTLASQGMMSFDEAVRTIHAPDDREGLAAAVRRLKFDELYTLQLGLRWRRARLEQDVAGLDNGPVEGGLADRFVDGLPYTPTGAQTRAMAEIAADLGAPVPMHRLLQGDVGSGKTLVAAWAMLNAVDHGRQAAMLVPTEVLAEQHHRTLLAQLDHLGVNMLDGPRVELLTGSTSTSEQRRVLSGLLTGEVDLVVGTHALLEERVRFADLGVVVIDEQHRFGVDQRVTIRDKRTDMPGERTAVDVLVMTATPIPRSLSLTVYGDLEVTVLDELPPGRQPVKTQLITPDAWERRARLEAFVRQRVAEGGQAYWVCPLVEPSEKIDVVAATAVYEQLRDEVFPDLRIALVHGQMSSADKDAAMTAFRAGEVDVLVATTVIEVGVDVPAATIMVIENAERFGISQLHQLRGRVGRGDVQSYCVLFGGWPSSPIVAGRIDHEPYERRERAFGETAPDVFQGDDGTEFVMPSLERLSTVAATTDGFALAEADMRARGTGTLFGTAQHGVQDLRLATVDDLDLIAASRRAAALTIEEDPDLDAQPQLAAQVRRRHRGLEQFAALETG